MWAVKIYGLLWLLVAAAAGILYLTDSFTFAAAMVLGFSASVLSGTGLLTVYPVLMNERAGIKNDKIYKNILR